jgi:inorganic triphosphatase YgiF
MPPAPIQHENIELQLTLLVDPTALDRLLELDCAQGAWSEATRAKGLSTVYFDRPGDPLAESNVSLRVEEAGRGYVQRVDSRLRQVGTAALCQASSAPILSSHPVPAAIGDKALRETLEGNGRDRLEPIYRTKIERVTRQLSLEDGTELTVDLDVGELTAKEAKRPISELTLRLRSGTGPLPFRLAQGLLARMPLRVATQGTTKRHLGLLSGDPPQSWKPGRLGLSPDATVEDALAHTVQHCLQHLMANEACVVQTEDPEGVHQTRVALRRFRSAVRLFRPVLPEQQRSWLNDELRFFGKQMAAARDWDVFAAEIVAPTLLSFSDQEPFHTLMKRVAECRNQSRNFARDALLSERYTKLLLSISARLAEQAWREQPDSESAAQLFRPARSFADARLTELHQRVCETGARFGTLSVSERHRLRILVKRLRYASNFFGSLYQEGPAWVYSDKLAVLQDDLGYVNDVSMAETLVAQLCRGRRGRVLEQCRFAGRMVVDWHAGAMAALDRKLARSVKSFIASRPFWSEQS